MSDFVSTQLSFAGGEMTPEFFGHYDDPKYRSGLALCQNMIVLPHGPVARRPGTKFVRGAKNNDLTCRLIPFERAADDTMVIEMGQNYFRFHTMGATLSDAHGTPAAYNAGTAYVPGNAMTSGGVTYYNILASTGNAAPNATYWYAMPTGVYEIPHTYTAPQLSAIRFVQSIDVITLTHPSHPPRELRRYDDYWLLINVVFGSTLDAPVNLAGVATAGATPGTPFDTVYVVTAIGGNNGADEGLQSASKTVSNNLYDDGAYNTLTWDATTGALRYNVYKQTAGLFGYIGQTDQLTFRDENIAADLGKTPPIDNTQFESTDNYPKAVGYFEQRRIFAGTNNEPQNVWGTKSGTEANMDYSIPPQDTDSLQFAVASRQANAIEHVLPMSDLLLLTASSVWRINSSINDILTPITLSAKEQATYGVSEIRPLLMNTTALYVTAQGGHVRELGLSEQGYQTGDISIRAPHLFDGYTITGADRATAPHPIAWFASNSGALVGLTYVPEEQVGAWHHTTTGASGTFEDVAVVAENNQSAVYVVVRRVINGSVVRYIERFESIIFAGATNAYFVDAGVTYDGAATATITSGLDHLEGETVSVLVDGAHHPDLVVTGGAITLAEGVTGELIHIGLPIVSRVQTLPLAAAVEGYLQGVPKNIDTVWMRVYNTMGFFAGPDFDNLVEHKTRTTELYGNPVGLKSEELELVVSGYWNSDGQLCVEEKRPVPLTILSLSVGVTVGG